MQRQTDFSVRERPSKKKTSMKAVMVRTDTPLITVISSAVLPLFPDLEIFLSAFLGQVQHGAQVESL